MLDYKLVQALALVVREGGFEKAAQALHLTQSAVSQRVKSLEREAGQVLLVRSSPPRPTAAGQEMLRHFLRVERLEGDLARAMQPAGDGHEAGWDTLHIGLNADSLATWFLDAVRPFLRTHRLLLDLSTADQEQTHTLLRSGEVVGCVSARADSVQGCRVTRLGCMVYRLVASPVFAARWFPEGVTRKACEGAPAVVFNHDDEMHDKVLARAFGKAPKAYPAHFVPSSERFVDMVADSLGYGMIPEYQAASHMKAGTLLDLAPELAVPVDLYWHCWDIGSPLLDRFSESFAENAWLVLDDEAEVAAQPTQPEDTERPPADAGADENGDLFGPG